MSGRGKSDGQMSPSQEAGKRRRGTDPSTEDTTKKRKSETSDSVAGSMDKSENDEPTSERNVTQLSAEAIAVKLENIGQQKAADEFRANKITGSVVDMITEERLIEMGIKETGDRFAVLKFIRNLPDQFQRKICNDPVHGIIELHPLCVKIIDTPQFQRLRYLKQLGACYFVYPGAAHNRFEHCLGVCHLAGQLVRTLKDQQPELDITKKDVLCVEIAGLCHDLGHGPFSHMFDGKFLPKVRPDKEWKHEDGSRMMFDYMVDVNDDLKKKFEEYGLDDIDRTFIKQLINGKSVDDKDDGRGKEKGFLYEIVANNKNGIDVDKWDYYARDCHGLGIVNNFNHLRCMKFLRVNKVEEEDGLHICFRMKEAMNIYGMFQTRAALHRRAYQHRVNNVIEEMITDAFEKADGTPMVPGKDGKPIKISDCIDDPVAFTNLNDSIVHVILLSTSTNAELKESRDILTRIHQRKLYSFVGETEPKKDPGFKKITENDIVSFAQSKLKEDDIIVETVTIGYGMKGNNLTENVWFYNKHDPTKAIKLEQQDAVSLMLPKEYKEKCIRVFCKDEEHKDIARQCFKKWCEKEGIQAKEDFVTQELQ